VIRLTSFIEDHSRIIACIVKFDFAKVALFCLEKKKLIIFNNKFSGSNPVKVTIKKSYEKKRCFLG
jgi:hypothetical protein